MSDPRVISLILLQIPSQIYRVSILLLFSTYGQVITSLYTGFDRREKPKFNIKRRAPYSGPHAESGYDSHTTNMQPNRYLLHSSLLVEFLRDTGRKSEPGQHWAYSLLEMPGVWEFIRRTNGFQTHQMRSLRNGDEYCRAFYQHNHCRKVMDQEERQLSIYSPKMQCHSIPTSKILRIQKNLQHRKDRPKRSVNTLSEKTDELPLN